MLRRPTTIRGWLLLSLITVPVSVFLVAKATPAMGSPIFWGFLAVAILTSLVLYSLRRRSEAARERAWVGTFSFGDVVRRIHAEEALAIAENGDRRQAARSSLLLSDATVAVTAGAHAAS
jgi:hypothetical protein